MDLPRWIRQAKEMKFSALAKASDALGAGAGYVKESISSGISLFGSTESSSSYSGEQLDERHYFLVPDPRTESDHSLHVMRCLPEGVPPINDLPRRRVLHLPSEHAGATLEHIARTEARRSAESEPAPPGAWSERMDEITDQIDRLENRVFGGVLLVGGLVALVNPVAGAVVAVKAMAPSLGLLLSKYGLEFASESLSERELTSRIQRAEREVLAKFRGSSTRRLVNPMLATLDEQLRRGAPGETDLLEFPIDGATEPDRERLRVLTCQAVTNVYADLLDAEREWASAGLSAANAADLGRVRAAASPQSE